MIREKDIYWIWFTRIEKVSCIQKEKLLRNFGTPQRIWELNKSDFKQIEWLNESIINQILNITYRQNLEKYEQYMNKNNIELINILDDEYPVELKNIYDKPIVLYVKGNKELLKKQRIAIVGSRNCSLYGKTVAQKLSYDLAKQNKCIISGLAKGIDTYAHIGALEADGETIAVIGNGLDTVYPIENRNVYERILQKNGLIVTEYVIGTKPNKLNFPARNRIISGLSESVVVVEAKEKSGALITVEFAIEQGKEVFAVPGNILSNTSVGTNELIKQGANIVTSYTDIINIYK